MTAAGDRVLVGLADELAIEPSRPGSTCWHTLFVQNLDPEDLTDLEAALSSSASSAQIARVLRRRGLYVADVSVRRHRRGECLCPR